jgi:hypothetical protein
MMYGVVVIVVLALAMGYLIGYRRGRKQGMFGAMRTMTRKLPIDPHNRRGLRRTRAGRDSQSGSK